MKRKDILGGAMSRLFKPGITVHQAFDKLANLWDTAFSHGRKYEQEMAEGIVVFRQGAPVGFSKYMRDGTYRLTMKHRREEGEP